MSNPDRPDEDSDYSVTPVEGAESVLDPTPTCWDPEDVKKPDGESDEEGES